MAKKLKPREQPEATCPECGLHISREEHDMFDGFCEECRLAANEDADGEYREDE